MGRAAFMFLVILALSAIVISVQGQTDQSTASATTTTTTTNDEEIHEYDIKINSIDNGHYNIGLKNNLLSSELNVFFDGKPVGSIPKGPAWKEFEVDKLPADVRVSGEGMGWHKDLIKYVPWAYNQNYKVIDQVVSDKNGNEVGLKIKVEYPSNLKLHEKGILDIKEITKDFGYAISPDTQNNIQTFSIIRIASDESLREESGSWGLDKAMLVDPIVIANGPTELLKPVNGWIQYNEALRDSIKSRYPKDVADATAAEGIDRLIDLVTLGDVRKAFEIALESDEKLDFKEICSAFANWQQEYTIGNAPSAMFSNENDFDCWTYTFGFNGYENLCTGANGIRLEWPFSFDMAGNHEIRLHLDTMFEGDIPSLGVKGGRLGKEFSLNMPVGQSLPSEIKEKEVVFPDTNLEAAIRAAINKPDGAIYAADLEGLKSLDASRKGIKNIAGLEYCSNLEELNLSNTYPSYPEERNQITNISPVSGLTKLQFMNMEGNQITDISPLSGLTNLQTLRLSFNGITDITPLSKLTNLDYLTLLSNQISDISALSGLTKLKRLALGNNQITDVSPLSSLPNLEGLNLWNDTISDISPLSRLTKLSFLELWGNPINDASPLSGLTNLEYLDLSKSDIIDLSPLSKLTNLKSLYLNNKDITDVSPLSKLTNLKTLQLNNNCITDISPLSGILNLKDLSLGNTCITDVSPLSKLTNLQTLNIGFNQITDVSPLSILSNLQTLGLAGNKITDVSPLSGLTKLKNLDLYGNQITDVSPLSKLSNLKDLDLRYNQITDVSPLSGLTNLKISR